MYPPVSSVQGILQERILEWVAISFSRDLSHSGIRPDSPALLGLQMDSLLTELPGKPWSWLLKALRAKAALDGPQARLDNYVLDMIWSLDTACLPLRLRR